MGVLDLFPKHGNGAAVRHSLLRPVSRVAGARQWLTWLAQLFLAERDPIFVALLTADGTLDAEGG